MCILNITPDSFFAGSRLYQQLDRVVAQAEKMIEEGATFLDVGGYSTRPMASEISVQEELDRVISVIELLYSRFPETVISVDTFRSEVAKVAVTAGASLVNDVSGGNLDEQMYQTVAQLEVPYCLMHMRGTPENMTQLNDYKNLILDIIQDLEKKVMKLRELNVKDILIDPGFGFAKNIEQNFSLLKRLSNFKIFDLPILAGLSRKSMIYKGLGLKDASEALNGTTALHSFALLNGANILRVHDVKEAKQCIDLFIKYTQAP